MAMGATLPAYTHSAAARGRRMAVMSRMAVRPPMNPPGPKVHPQRSGAGTPDGSDEPDGSETTYEPARAKSTPAAQRRGDAGWQ